MSSNPSRRHNYHTTNKRGCSELFRQGSLVSSKIRNNNGRGDSSEDSRSDDTATKSTILRKKKPRHERPVTGGGGGPIRSIMGWNLFVTGLPHDVGSDQVEEHFAAAATQGVQSIRLIRNAGRRWYGKGSSAIVEFASQIDAQNAINRFHNSTFRKGVVLSVTWAFVQQPPTTTILVG